MAGRTAMMDGNEAVARIAYQVQRSHRDLPHHSFQPHGRALRRLGGEG